MLLRDKLNSLAILISIAMLIFFNLIVIFLKTPAILGLAAPLVFIIFIALAAVIMGLLAILSKLYSAMDKKSFLIFIILLTVIPRLAWILCVNTIPSSDFGHLHDYGVNASKGLFTSYVDFYAVFPFKISYGLFLAGIYKLVGINVFAVKLVNIMLSIALGLTLYWIGKMVFNEKAGRICAVMFALWPAQIMYCSVLASEHLFIVFFMLALGIFLRFRNCESKAGTFIFLSLSGFLIALAQVVRPMAMILLPVIAVYLIFTIQKDTGFKKDLIRKMQIFLFVILGFAFGMAAVGIPVEKITGVPLWSSSSGFNLLVGTNYKYTGMFNKQDFSIIEEYNYSRDAVHREAQARAIERIKSDPVGFVKLAVKKLPIQWGDENYGFTWSTLEIDKNKSGNLIKSNPFIFAAAAQYFYMALLLLGAAGFLFMMKRRIYEAAIFFMIVAGIFAAYIFLEVQPRYHFPAVPVFILAAGFGLDMILEKLEKQGRLRTKKL